MTRRVSSLDKTTVGIDRDISSQYDNVKTVADNILDVEIVADNIGAVLTVEQNAQDALASQTAAAISETNAAASEAAAATSETNATISETNAATSETNAAATLTAFQNIYYGPSASAPVTNINVGDLYFDTTDSIMKVCQSTGPDVWINSGSTVNGISQSTRFVATAGQTTFSMVYDPGFLNVFINGLWVDSADYTAVDGANIVLTTPAELDDIIYIIAFSIFAVADTYTIAQTDTAISDAVTSHETLHPAPTNRDARNQIADINTVIDASYVHTDNNYTTQEKTELGYLTELNTTNGFDRQNLNLAGTLSYSDVNRTLTIDVKVGQSVFEYWVDGVKFSSASAITSVAIPNTTGIYFFYLDDLGDLIPLSIASFTDDVIFKYCLVGAVYWNATTGAGLWFDERHGHRMDSATHSKEHNTLGSVYSSGFGISGLVDGSGVYTQIDSGVFYDEDIKHIKGAELTQPFLYRSGATGQWVWTVSDNHIAYDTGGGVHVWNEWTGATWVLTPTSPSKDHFLTFYVEMNTINGLQPSGFKIIGQNAYKNEARARAAIDSEIANLNLEGLPSAEIIFLGATISDNNGNLHNLADGSVFYDLRGIKVTGSGGVSGTATVAGDVTTTVTTFNGQLSATDTDVQSALETLDDHVHDMRYELITNVAAMTEAEFNAIAASNRDKFAGSGFVEWGKVYTDTSGFPTVNEGIFTSATTGYENRFILGFGATGVTTGNSKTDYPLVNVNGVVSQVGPLNALDRAAINLPPAPVATNLITTASNGTFDDATGLTLDGATVSGGTLNFTGTVYQSCFFNIDVPAGVPHLYELDISSLTSGTIYVHAGGASFESFASAGKYRFTLTTAAGDTAIYIDTGASVCSIGSLSVIDLGKVERQDLVFLETWHEKISDKDIVYPFGNTQSLLAADSATGLATVNGSFTGFETYSLFGNWQASSALIGKGLVWSTMSDANKKLFVADPENNCYLAPDGSIVQVRYRIRVVEGLGADWASISDTALSGFFYDASNYVHAKGQQVSIAADLAGAVSNHYIEHTSVSGALPSDIGSWKTRAAGASTAYGDKCFATPIALVSRRNQGAFHPVFNPNGTGSYWYADGNAGGVVDHWFSSLAKQPLSTADCFTVGANTAGVNTTPFMDGFHWGAIATGEYLVSRPDKKFYDAIYEGDVLDLRNSAHKQDLTRTLEREFNKLVAGEMRGWQKSRKITHSFAFTANSVGYNSEGTYAQYNNNLVGPSSIGAIPNINPVGYVIDGGGVPRKIQIYGYTGGLHSYFYLTTDYGNISSQFTAGNSYRIVIFEDVLIPYKTNLVCDIIGDPANYPQSWKDNGVMGNALLVGEEGGNFIPDSTSKNLKLSRKAKSDALLAVYSFDSGVTWTPTATTIGSVNNLWTGGATSQATGIVVMVFYEAEASPFEPASNAEVLKLGEAYGTQQGDRRYGGALNDLINKVGVYAYNGDGTKKAGIPYNYEVSELQVLMVGALAKPSHLPISLTAVNPAVKVLPYLTRENGKLFLQTLYKEMKYDVDWGDDNTFNAVDNDSTTIDDNANTVLIGQKRLELPYFIGDGE